MVLHEVPFSGIFADKGIEMTYWVDIVYILGTRCGDTWATIGRFDDTDMDIVEHRVYMHEILGTSSRTGCTGHNNE